jgi:c-di-GMP-binding flagellar brake protein YcgR
MFDDLNPVSELFVDDEAIGMLQELSANTPEEVQRKRAYFRLTIKAGVIAQPGNASDLVKLKIQGTTVDLSEGGLSAVFPGPIRVGDVYRLVFDPVHLDLPLTFARCVRCRLIHEDAFEAGFAFFSTITLPENIASTTASPVIS